MRFYAILYNWNHALFLLRRAIVRVSRAQKLVRDCIFLIISQKPLFCTSFYLYLYLVIVRALDRFNYWAHAHQLDFLYKNQFLSKPRHLRGTRDLSTRVFVEKNLILSCILLFVRYLESYFEKEVKMYHTKIYTVHLNSACQEVSIRGFGIVVAL